MMSASRRAASSHSTARSAAARPALRAVAESSAPTMIVFPRPSLFVRVADPIAFDRRRAASAIRHMAICACADVYRNW